MPWKREKIGRTLARFGVAAVLAAAASGVAAETSDYGSLARVEAFRTAADLVSTYRGGYADPYEVGYSPFRSAQSWTAHIDWAAHNSDAGGSVDCPAQYIENGVEYAIVKGGRSTVINEALFDAYHQDFDGAFNLVLMTQCHNPEGQQELREAGERYVLTYLITNYKPTGTDPNQIIELARTALEALATMQ